MKFAAVILLACVAVSSAAFTANLVQHSQPALNKAMFQMRLVAGDKAVAIPAVQQILDHIQNTVNSLLAQAQAAVAQGQAISQQLVAQLQQAVQSLQQIGGSAANSLQQVIQNFLNGVSTILPGGNKGAVQDAVAAVQAAVAHLQQLAQNLVAQIDLPALITQAVNAVLPPQVAQLVIAQLNLNNKGVIGDLFGNLWGQLSQGASQIAQQVAQIAQQIQQVGQSAVAEVQAQASQFLANVASGAANVSAAAAQQLLAHISDLQGALGNQYQAVVDALNGIVVNGN